MSPPQGPPQHPPQRPLPPRHRQNLIEQAVGAWRPRGLDGAVRTHPAWADLSVTDRQAVFDETLHQRAIEAALDPDGLSSTGQAVLDRITRG